IELTHTLEHERLEPSRTTRLDYKPDPDALPGAIDATWITVTSLRLLPEFTASRLKRETAALPAIRAPPPFPSR
ncbi:MAG TPA: hypothetical protein VFG52_03310, partial [Xanthomonadales bacterium]|nr:hypothetical protein [Xanthomonadales bacterium]